MELDEASQVVVRSRKDLRAWLAVHHEGSGSIWLVTYKKPSPDHLPYPDLVEKLFC